MSSNSILMIKTYEQLKAISDPLRISVISQIAHKSKTGKQIGESLNVSAPKIHYHLKELEKVGIVYIEKIELLNGIAQKFYITSGTDIVIDPELIPHLNELKESIRASIYSILSKSKAETLSAPEESFSVTSGEYMDWPIISIQTYVNINRDQFMEWKKKYHNLLDELATLEKNNKGEKTRFFISSVGFEASTEEGENQ
ncbi:winged helix-turn-helix domain-containing protein [Bacillus spongiae]|uniref:Winged helix-turn-helix domain-containing protein n=1 Tax=Bacillus spongiae TaxID=2683610 RepID=A0ABU8HF15_9BACI